MGSILTKKALLVTLTVSAWGERTQDKEVTEEVLVKHKAEQGTGQFTKILVNSTATKELRSVRSTARSYHLKHTLPWVTNGPRILPVKLYEDYKERIEACAETYGHAADRLIQRYPEYKELAKRQLGDLYNEDDYPSNERLRKAYSITMFTQPCPEGNDFHTELLKDQERELRLQLDKQVNAQLKTAMQDVGTRITDVVSTMVDKLKAYKPGNATKGIAEQNSFRDSLIWNVKDLTHLVEVFNMGEDKKIAAINTRLKKELCAYDSEELKEDGNARKKVTKSALEILDHVKDYLG